MPAYFVAVPGEVPVLLVPGATCDLMSPGEPCDLVAAAPAPGDALPPVMPLPELRPVPPPGGDWVLVVPGAICALMSPGEPCDLVASEAPGAVVDAPLPLLMPPAGAPAPPGELPDFIVPGAPCAGMSPGEPCDRVASAAGVVCANALPAIRTQAENIVVLILFMS